MRNETRSLTPRMILLLLVTVLLSACGHHGESHDHDAEAHGDGSATHAANGAHGLALDGSEKWEMDEHTRAVFSKMAERLASVDLGALPADELKASGALLREDVDELIAGCTMVGAAHDELHKYLSAYIPAVSKLAQEGSLAKAEEVRELLELYPRYFE